MKFHVVALFVLCFHGGSCQNSACDYNSFPFDCSGLPDGEYPISQNDCCESFILCVGGLSFFAICPPNQLFNPVDQKCEGETDCQASLTTVETTTTTSTSSTIQTVPTAEATYTKLQTDVYIVAGVLGGVCLLALGCLVFALIKLSALSRLKSTAPAMRPASPTGPAQMQPMGVNDRYEIYRPGINNPWGLPRVHWN